MISSSEKIKCLEMKITKKNTWKNHKIDIEIKIKNQFPNTIFFFEYLFSIPLVFLTLELIILSYLLGSFVLWEKNWFVVFWSLSCKPSYFVLSLLCRGWFWSGGFVPYPSSERLIGVWLCAHPSSVRWLILVALCLTSKCRGGFCNWERSCVLPCCIAPNPQWRFPVWESCVDKLVDWKSFCVKAGT